MIHFTKKREIITELDSDFLNVWSYACLGWADINTSDELWLEICHLQSKYRDKMVSKAYQEKFKKWLLDYIFNKYNVTIEIKYH